MIFSIVTPRQ